MPKSSRWIEIDYALPVYKAWKKHTDTAPNGEYAHQVFKAGWDAALEHLSTEIKNIREMEDGLRRQIEELYRGNPPIDSGANSP